MLISKRGDRQILKPSRRHVSSPHFATFSISSWQPGDAVCFWLSTKLCFSLMSLCYSSAHLMFCSGAHSPVRTEGKRLRVWIRERLRCEYLFGVSRLSGLLDSGSESLTERCWCLQSRVPRRPSQRPCLTDKTEREHQTGLRFAVRASGGGAKLILATKHAHHVCTQGWCTVSIIRQTHTRSLSLALSNWFSRIWGFEKEM